MPLRLAFHLYFFPPIKWCYILSLPVFLSFIESAPTNFPLWLDDLSTTWNHFRKLPRSGSIPTFYVHHFKTPFTTMLLIFAQWSWHEETYTKIRATCYVVMCACKRDNSWYVKEACTYIHQFYLSLLKLIRLPSQYYGMVPCTCLLSLHVLYPFVASLSTI